MTELEKLRLIRDYFRRKAEMDYKQREEFLKKLEELKKSEQAI